MKSVKYIVSSEVQEWQTPDKIFSPLHEIFKFNIDLCANVFNRKVKKFFDINDNCLTQDWTFKTGWLNPPYSKPRKIDPLSGTGQYIKKAFSEVYELKNMETCVILIPNNTEAKHYHETIFSGHSILFFRGRISFQVNCEAKNKNTRGSCLIIFSRKRLKKQLDQLDALNLGKLIKL